MSSSSAAPAPSQAPDAYATLPSDAHDLLALSPTLAVLKLGLPLALASFFQAAFNLTEVWVFGTIDDHGASLSGAAVSDMLTGLFALLASGLSNAAVTQIAQATGAGDEAYAQAATRAAVFMGLLLSLGLAVVGLLAGPLGHAFMHESAREIGTDFLRIMALGGFGTIFMVLLIGILRARGDSIRPLVLVACVSVATLLAEMAFIFGWGGLDPSGIVACAWVTVALRALTTAWGLWMVNQDMPLRPARGVPFVQRPVLAEQLRLGLTSALQQAVRIAAMLALIALANLLVVGAAGRDLFTALTIWSKIDIPMIMLAFAWGGATAPVVGMALGAKEPDHARRAAWAGVRVAGFASLLNVFMVFVFGSMLVAAFLPTDPSAQAVTMELLYHLAPVYPLVAAGIAAAYAFYGAGDMVRPLYWDLALLLGAQTSLAWLLAGPLGLGAAGFFIALTVSGVLQGVVPSWWLRRRARAWKRTAGSAAGG